MMKQLLFSYGFEPSEAFYFVWGFPTSGKMKTFGQLKGEILYKINAQKPLAFLYINDEKSEREIRETLPFTIATKRINT